MRAMQRSSSLRSMRKLYHSDLNLESYFNNLTNNLQNSMFRIVPTMSQVVARDNDLS